MHLMGSIVYLNTDSSRSFLLHWIRNPTDNSSEESTAKNNSEDTVHPHDRHLHVNHQYMCVT